MLSWFQALMPREERFFDLFERHAATLVAGSHALRDLLNGGDRVLVCSQEIRRQENEADAIVREAHLAVRRTFITPFDRSDIRDLVTAMDDAIDQMHQTAKATLLYETRDFEPGMRRMGDIIVQSAELTRSAIPLLRLMRQNAGRLNAFSEEITRIEDEADAIHDQGLKELFLAHRHKDPMAFIVGAEIYGHLERVVDGFEDVADRVAGIVIEHTYGRRLQNFSFYLIGLVAVALIFDFLNGLHDAANSIATIVSTRVLRPQFAVAWAAFFNFIAFLFFGLHVAQTVGAGIVSPDIVDDFVVFGALMGAIVWNLITWGLGIPSSSSHALVGGLVGAGVAKVGASAIVWNGLLKTGVAIVLSPALGFVLALALILLVSWIFVRRTPGGVDSLFRILQFASASLYSLGHGGNDAQKTMGVIAVLLYSHGALGGEFYVPFWVVIACQAAMGLGTLFGGWRIVRTMGSRITRLTPVQGFCAETGGAITLFLATALGVPVSTTHTITGAIIGVGASRRVAAVRWNVAKDIVVAWVITMPMAAFFAAAFYVLARFAA